MDGAAREAALPGISSFAKDLDAVTNGLTMNWSSVFGRDRVDSEIGRIRTTENFWRASPLLV
jgi:hypothetical protein